MALVAIILVEVGCFCFASRQITSSPLPESPATDDIVSDKIIFEIGDSRFAIRWTAEIERLPPAGPVAVGRKQRPKLDRSPQ